METINPATPFIRGNKAFFIDTLSNKADISSQDRYKTTQKVTFYMWRQVRMKDIFIFGYVEFNRRLSQYVAQNLLPNALLIPVSASLSLQERTNLISQAEYHTIGKPREHSEHKETKMSSGEQSIAS